MDRLGAAAIFLLLSAEDRSHWLDRLPAGMSVVGWLGAATVPLAVGWALRGRDAWPVAFGLAWATLGVVVGDRGGAVPYLWLGVLAVGLTGWGVRDHRVERVNLGVAGFALTVVAFYFSSVMDKLGRSASLIGLGLLFLGGGYVLEMGRRRLVAGIRGPA